MLTIPKFESLEEIYQLYFDQLSSHFDGMYARLFATVLMGKGVLPTEGELYGENGRLKEGELAMMLASIPRRSLAKVFILLTRHFAKAGEEAAYYLAQTVALVEQSYEQRKAPFYSELYPPRVAQYFIRNRLYSPEQQLGAYSKALERRGVSVSFVGATSPVHYIVTRFIKLGILPEEIDLSGQEVSKLHEDFKGPVLGTDVA